MHLLLWELAVVSNHWHTTWTTRMSKRELGNCKEVFVYAFSSSANSAFWLPSTSLHCGQHQLLKKYFSIKHLHPSSLAVGALTHSQAFVSPSLVATCSQCHMANPSIPAFPPLFPFLATKLFYFFVPPLTRRVSPNFAKTGN